MYHVFIDYKSQLNTYQWFNMVLMVRLVFTVIVSLIGLSSWCYCKWVWWPVLFFPSPSNHNVNFWRQYWASSLWLHTRTIRVLPIAYISLMEDRYVTEQKSLEVFAPVPEVARWILHTILKMEKIRKRKDIRKYVWAMLFSSYHFC